MLSNLERRLGQALLEHPSRHGYRYTKEARQDLLELLFHCMTGYNEEYLRLLFPNGFSESEWKLSEAQGAVEGAEYTESARGKRCGHIFKNGEASYHCMTCSTDDTCALCTRCFDSSDHTGHKYSISLSSGYNGCCDCGDEEAFKIPVLCAIHTATPRDTEGKGKSSSSSHAAQTPVDLVESITTTISRAYDYFCDVISCSPEQLRLPKTEAGIREDEAASRLLAEWYGGSDPVQEEPEFALVLWNDEKHTVTEVANQVVRACREASRFGVEKANETHEIGRSVVKYSKDLENLLVVSKIIEQIRVTVTVRSARDTYREQMCGTIIEWLSDIASCSIGDDNDLLRQTVCDQMIQPWRLGSRASNADIGKSGIYDNEEEDRSRDYSVRVSIGPEGPFIEVAAAPDDINPNDDGEVEEGQAMGEGEDDENGNEDEEDEDMDEVDTIRLTLEQDVETMEARANTIDADVEMPDNDLEIEEATLVAYPSPLPPPPPSQDPRQGDNQDIATLIVPTGPDSEGPAGSFASGKIDIPKTPGARFQPSAEAPSYWVVKPQRFYDNEDLTPYEDLRKRTRLDWIILFDLRLWKKTRTDVREMCLGTVVNVPQFKRILGLRFSALYTALAQLYLIADREPDHSIINLSLQLLTTPSITEEVVERGNFLTNIMAILYTFLTTRQVGEPHDVHPNATLSIDTGSVTNRRLYHFFLDLRYLLLSEHVKRRIRSERQYLMQFLDLVKLPQGICPNVRAVEAHVEYETEGWIGASILMREINRLCRLFCEAFRTIESEEDADNLVDAIATTAYSTMINSLGLERLRFVHAEILDFVRFKSVPFVEFEKDAFQKVTHHRIVEFAVDRGSISFHHALHYTLSWLLEYGRAMSPEKMRDVLIRAAEMVRSQRLANSPHPYLSPDDILLTMFDYPLRVCAWLAQMKAGMWVRNGLSLRHQMSQYRAVTTREMAFYRDIFLLQTAFVVCDPSRFLASLIDRFGVGDWMRGNYVTRPGYEDAKHVDILEEMVHLMIVLVTDRTSLSCMNDEDSTQNSIMARDIAHALCFKPLSYTDLTIRMNDKSGESGNFQEVLAEVATFRPPEGMNDTGTFELKPDYLDLVDPYCTHYTKNQREEAENLYKQWMAKKTGKDAASIVFEPKLRVIRSGAYVGLSNFTQTPLFAQVIHHCLDYCLTAKTVTKSITTTRIETLLHLVLHTILLATLEDHAFEDDTHENLAERSDSTQSFVYHALCRTKFTRTAEISIIGLLQNVSTVPEFSSCGPKIRHILKKFWQMRPKAYAAATIALKFPYDNIEAPSPAGKTESELELKKKQALDRQARVMAQFQQQQQNFLEAQGSIDWGEEDDISEAEEPSILSPTEKKLWKYPAGRCILCQEDTNDSRIYGTFAFMADSRIFRQTDMADSSYVGEVLKVPSSLDRSADNIRPFGVAGENRKMVRSLDSTGGEVITEKQGLGKGFSPKQAAEGPVTTGCGHIMHYHCFEDYYSAAQRRHHHQVARNHPERLPLNEFVCPLCKALGNAFLPIIWKGKEESYPGALNTADSFNEFLDETLVYSVTRFRNHALIMESDKLYSSGYQDLFVDYVSKNFINPLSHKVNQLATPALPELLSFPQPTRMQMPGLYPPADEIISMGPTPTQPITAPATTNDAMVTELVSIYKQLRETIRLNGVQSQFGYPGNVSDDLIHTDVLIRTLGLSITAAEIAQRGVGYEGSTTLLAQIPQLTLTHLRVLSETAFSYCAVGGLNTTATNKTVYEFRDMHRRRLCQLFVGHPGLSGLSNLAYENKSIEPLLRQDSFVFLTECSLCIVPVLNLDILHVVRLCYVAEIVKTFLGYILRPQGFLEVLEKHGSESSTNDDPMSPHESLTKAMLHWLVKTYKASSVESSVPEEGGSYLLNHAEDVSIETVKSLRLLIDKYALPFLRKAVILLHVRFGVEFPNTGSDYNDLAEIDRLATLLNLPSIDSIFDSLVNSDGEDNNNIIALLVSGWISHFISWFPEDSDADDQQQQQEQHQQLATLSLPHPAIFELVGLPKYFDTLLDEATRRRCKTTGKELTDPSICLFCGDIFCSQAVCCRGQGDWRLGGCNRHVAICGKNIGLFINIRKCMALFLHNKNGCWHHAPYLDIHGEVDPGFRHHRRLILNQKRYDRLLRDVWLSHGIPAVISRRLEAEINNGGWESI
ncbi:E3 ubiquitin-protein ligase ubr11 [Histoplasma capsulatum G186AR]|uniref:E3 ubiquitin-protein ligase n=2 Tax=Ajellomyces capsulatus TaxID=5037 RepID=C0NSF8_AJECG|nr:E3 ubiquitin-protein ligase ubr11 [Histoplasma capsulatum G186AR]EEH05824.1 E3 ubiquitin-protein ligase ubr11 [Histoplasma capsulatum G186AR]